MALESDSRILQNIVVYLVEVVLAADRPSQGHQKLHILLVRPDSPMREITANRLGMEQGNNRISMMSPKDR
jgi:hypothetical protein